ncbi:lipopolysaccharide biosynthesis protein [Flavobacterium tegetincola]|uniref:lipopolysaccharide biosynthesis protein n=1 Tax=Flavobacterium tegetincola TaxID=150172 RepID=UPI00041FE008|nr:oligosaccharide flippase family protein [Flavobacterium tegetincola]
MGLFKNLFKQTAIYGLATVVPRMLSFILVRLYTDLLPAEEYGRVSVIFVYIIFFNVILAYGMETSFFRFYNTEENKKSVVETSMVSIFWTTISFLAIALLFRNSASDFLEIDVQYITYVIWILALDALVIIPFSKLRAYQRPLFYAAIKIGNVVVNLGLNLFFLLLLPEIASDSPKGLISSIYFENFEIGYIFISNIVASLLTFLVLVPNYFQIKWKFDFSLWKRMMKYGFPILIAGIAFAINDQVDKLLLNYLLPADVAEEQVGIYAACYKLGLFMVLFRTAYTLGIEPFFFSYASNENAKQTYATITKYFVIFGSLMTLGIIVFADVLKFIMIPNSIYWDAMGVVPLIILANFFLGIYTNLSVWYKLTNQTHIGAWISIVGAVLTLVLNFLLIPVFQENYGQGFMGAAIATIVAYGMMMFISYVLGNKYYPIPYDMKKISSYLGISILFSAVYFYLFRENYFVGVPMLIAFTYFIYYNEKELINRILKRKV